MPHQGHFLESDVPKAAYLFNSPLHGKNFTANTATRDADHFHTVRYAADGTQDLSLSKLKSPFVIEEASNVFLETIKRGDDDVLGLQEAEPTIVLRLYEAYGGHGRANLKVASHVPIRKAFVTNLLEDDGGEELNIMRTDDSEETGATLRLDFRGFEVKTVKLVLATEGSVRPKSYE